MDAQAGTQIDHKNRDGLDNRRSSNLRFATHSENQLNRRPLFANNTTGYAGVYYHKATGRWRAHKDFNKRTFWLGYFDTAEEAAEAVKVHDSQVAHANT